MYNTTYDFDIKDKTYGTEKKKGVRVFPICLIVTGAAMLLGGGIWYNNTDMSKYRSIQLKEVAETIDGGKAEKVEISVGAGSVIVGVSEDDQVHLSGNVPADYVLKENGGTLRIDLAPDTYFNFNDLSTDPTSAEVYLPAKEYAELIIDTGAGKTTVNGVKCKKADIDSGAGEVEIHELECSGVLKSDVGTGKFTAEDTVTGGLDLDIGVGKFTYSGAVNGDIDIDCGVGECTIDLTNNEKEYNKKYRINKDEGIGDIDIHFAE